MFVKVKRQNEIHLDFIVDKLSESIINTISGDTFLTEVSLLIKDNLKQSTRKNEGDFS